MWREERRFLKLEEEICQILRGRFRCTCGSRQRYCKYVSELFELTLEKCEEEVEEAQLNG
jgi:hypothetical protein